MSGFELFGSSRARTCVISTLDDITDHYPITVLMTGFSLIVRLAIVTLLLTETFQPLTAGYLAMVSIAIYCAGLLVNVAPWVLVIGAFGLTRGSLGGFQF